MKNTALIPLYKRAKFMGLGILFCLTASATIGQSTITVAHRGAWKSAVLPQNSIASLKEAIRLGCGGTEFDVQLTADDSLVVNHDPTFQDDTIEKSTFATLTAHQLSNKESLPTLRSYLQTGLKQDKTKLVLEIKPSIFGSRRAVETTKKVLEMVAQMHSIEKILFISFDYEVLKAIHLTYPNASTQYLKGDKSPAALKSAGISGADYHYSVFQKHPNWITQAREQGIDLNAWTVNDTTVIDWLLANHFEAITTNEPALVMERTKRFHKIYGKRRLSFADEFNQKGLPDTTRWAYDVGDSGWGNHELQYYTKGDAANVMISGGFLHVMAKKDPQYPKGYSSARLVMKKGFKYGRLEVRAKLPIARGLWPAIWLLPDENHYGSWPKSGEIDLMENVGYMPDSVFFTVHTQKYNHVIHTQRSKSHYAPELNEFHTYALEWNKQQLTFFMDDQKMYSFKNEHQPPAWPFDHAFHLLLNIAVGGDWGGKEGIDPAAVPATMEIDYVRVFQ